MNTPKSETKQAADKVQQLVNDMPAWKERMNKHIAKIRQNTAQRRQGTTR